MHLPYIERFSEASKWLSAKNKFSQRENSKHEVVFSSKGHNGGNSVIYSSFYFSQVLRCASVIWYASKYLHTWLSV